MAPNPRQAFTGEVKRLWVTGSLIKRGKLWKMCKASNYQHSRQSRKAVRAGGGVGFMEQTSVFWTQWEHCITDSQQL